MPLFEYRCAACNHRFEELVHGDRHPGCPKCKSRKTVKQLSVFAVARSSGAASDSASMSDADPGACGTCGDPDGPGSCGFDGGGLDDSDD
jgi:putative FmdB family regulatory protein